MLNCWTKNPIILQQNFLAKILSTESGINAECELGHHKQISKKAKKRTKVHTLKTLIPKISRKTTQESKQKLRIQIKINRNSTNIHSKHQSNEFK